MKRGRPLTLPSDFQEYDFSQLAKKEQHARTRIRYIGLANLQKGKSAKEVSQLLSVHVNTVKNWLNSFREKGLAGVQEQAGRGAKRKLGKEQEEAFRKAVLELQANRNGGRIRGLDVLELMKEKL